MLEKSIKLLKEIIAIPSLSAEEEKVANLICDYLLSYSIKSERIGNNIIAKNLNFKKGLPTLMLNSHIDTVAPSSQYTFDPFSPIEDGEKIYGLGSNDAGGALVTLIHTFISFYKSSLPINIVLQISAEEENSGKNGIKLLVQRINQEIDFAIIGEPTQCKAAIAERGLLVLDCKTSGESAHAAYSGGKNAIYQAIQDIEKIKKYKFDKESPILGKITPNVTMISGGKAHNIIPDECNFVVDIRTTEQYTNKEIVNLLQKEVACEIKARSLTNKSSVTPIDSTILRTIKSAKIETFVSHTTSDWMQINIPAIKIGPGDSLRSHKADEYIIKSELNEGLKTYNKIINELIKIYNEQYTLE